MARKVEMAKKVEMLEMVENGWNGWNGWHFSNCLKGWNDLKG